MDRIQVLESVIEVNSCWLWKGKLSEKYGPFKQVYKLFKGEIPEGLYLDHICRIKSCVNPEHLEPITHTENMRRKPSYPRFVYPKKELVKFTFDCPDKILDKLGKEAKDNQRSTAAQLRVILKERFESK